MSLEMWKQQIKQRLDASVEDILGIFEQAVAEYKQELSSLKADVQQMMLISEGAPEELGTSADQQDPEYFNIKNEQEELWTSLEGEQLHRKEETDNAESFTAEDGKPEFSQLHPDRAVPTSSSGDQVTAATGRGAKTIWNQDLNTAEDDLNSSETDVSEDYQDEQDADDSDSGQKTGDADMRTSGAPESDDFFSCSECGKQFVHKGSLQRHMTSHSVLRVSSCFNKEKTYRVRKTVDPCREVQTSPKLFRYDDRGERFTVKTNLNGHSKIYMEQKPFACDVCEQRFKSKANLSRHMRTHTGQKPFGCDVCGQRFRDDTNLDRHMRSHTGEKPFMCDVCGRGFKDKSTLGRHMRIHTGQKPFGCYVCGRTFSQKTHLNRHMSIHTRPSVL
ncbi:zinc finger protein 37 [Austrofundulus limnaeus]|uniref:Zinc finger protein 37 n=1 Tax=Austrofundulus limnaeus TaxID=52670 RepID=A0A2I4DDD1_AUSLI|nr:PREDICTED: zinc finger protein 37-like [Austrofundulus limnaeus]